MAKRRVGRRGRWTVALAIGVFLLVATSVVWRRARGIATASTLEQLSTQLSRLQTQRAQLESEIRSQSSMSHLGAQVQGRLGMRVPNDSMVILLPRPRRRDGH